MDHIVYSTPAGAICTCGFVCPTRTGADARRRAQQHIQDLKIEIGAMKLIDLRTAARPQ